VQAHHVELEKRLNNALPELIDQKQAFPNTGARSHIELDRITGITATRLLKVKDG
jgi:hypothetical protein